MNPTVRGEKTAIRRNKSSAPCSRLHEMGLLQGRCLDYGSGKGDDVEAYGMSGWDPAHSPAKPRGKFDTITCSYVLNVVQAKDIPYILKDIRRLLKPGGHAYLTVRRDLGGKARKGNGTVQRHVVLKLPVVYFKSSEYIIYKLTSAKL